MTVTECLGSLFSFWLNFSRIVLVGVLTNIIYEYHGSSVIMLSYSVLEIVVYSNLIVHTVKWLHATIPNKMKTPQFREGSHLGAGFSDQSCLYYHYAR